MPDANQFYRVFTAGQDIPRGYGELRLGELREAAARSSGVEYSSRVPARLLQTRLAFAAAPAVLMVLALVLAKSWPSTPPRPRPAGSRGSSCFTGFVMAQVQREPSPAWAAWEPNILMLLIALTMVLFVPSRGPGQRTTVISSQT